MPWFVRLHCEFPISAKFHLDHTKTKYNYRDKKGVIEKRSSEKKHTQQKSSARFFSGKLRGTSVGDCRDIKQCCEHKTGDFFFTSFECHQSVQVNTFMGRKSDCK